jgi:hypothetical protein
MKKLILHTDGTVSFWSVYCQVQISRTKYVSDDELAAMNPTDRERVINHLAAHAQAQAQVDRETDC